MTATLDTPTTLDPTDATVTTDATSSTETTSTAAVNARGEAVFLQAETYALTARQIVHALAFHLTRYGDTLAVTVVDPLTAVDAVIRFDLGHHPGGLTEWASGRAPADVALVLARAEHIARDFFGTHFPPIRW